MPSHEMGLITGPPRRWAVPGVLAVAALFGHVWSTAVPPWDSTRIPGVNGDNLVMLWNLQHMRDSVARMSLGFKSHALFHPQGVHFLYSTHHWLDGLILGLLQWVPGLRGEAGLIRSYNLLQAFATVATVLLAFAGLRIWGVRDGLLRAALGLALAFCGFRVFAAQGHQHFHSTHWMLAALASLGLWRLALARGRMVAGRVWAGLTGLLMGLAFLNDATLGVFTGCVAGPTALLIAARRLVSHTPRGRAHKLEPPLHLALLFGIAGVLAAGHLKPIRGAIRTGLVEYVVPALDQERITDATSLLLPPDSHRWWGAPMVNLRQTYDLTTETEPYLGTAFLLLFAAGLAAAATRLLLRRGQSKGGVAARSRRLRTAAAFVIGGALLLAAFGDRWTVGRHQAPFASPATLLKHVPIVNNIRMPYRWSWPALVCLSLALGLVLDRRRQFPAPLVISRSSTLVLLSAIAIAEARPREPKTTDLLRDPILNAPGLAEAVRARHTGGSVAVVPHYDIFRPMRWQIAWGLDIPLAAGYVARIPPHGRTPIRGPRWTPEVEQWLKARDARILLISAFEPAGTWDDFATSATRAIPGLQVIREADHSDPWNGRGANIDSSFFP